MLYELNGGWPQCQENSIAQMLDQSFAVWDDVRLIGLARAVTDELFRGYTEDVVVHPQYRRQGLMHRANDAR